jgi:hypothetical protein
MTREIQPGEADFNVLADYLRQELDKMAADERAVHLTTSHSFATWAKSVVGGMAESLGLSLGLLAGHLVDTYETVKRSFSSGWREGLDRGRGRTDTR